MRDYRERLDGFGVGEIIEVDREPGICWRIEKLWVKWFAGRELHLAILVCTDPGTHNRWNRKVGTRRHEINTCFFRKLTAATAKRENTPMTTSSKAISIDSICIEGTYAGVLEGLPTPEQIITSAKARAKRLWGERPAFVVPPVTSPLRTSREGEARERCPPWCVLAWLRAPALKDGDGSELVVIWFQDTPGFEIPGAILADLSCDSWEKHAKDWWI
jgi:hypothetical protein